MSGMGWDRGGGGEEGRRRRSGEGGGVRFRKKIPNGGRNTGDVPFWVLSICNFQA